MSNGDAKESAERWKPPYMPWFEGDFCGSFNVRKMPPLARLMYRSLLQQGWHSDYPPFLPNIDADLMLMADAPSLEDWEQHKACILERFKKTPDCLWLYHPKAVREYNRAVSQHERKQAAGVQRWQGSPKARSESTAPVEQEQSATTSEAEQDQSNRRAPTPRTTTTTTSTATSISAGLQTALAVKPGAMSPCPQSEERNDNNDLEALIEQICQTHPRLQKTEPTRQFILAAAHKEIAKGMSASEALGYLLRKTEAYRRKTDRWPLDQRRYIVSSCEFFRTGEYGTNPQHWEKSDVREPSKAVQRGNNNRLAILEGLGLADRIEPAPCRDTPTLECSVGRGDRTLEGNAPPVFFDSEKSRNR